MEERKCPFCGAVMQVEYRISGVPEDSARMIPTPTPTPPDEKTKRRAITPEDTEELIQYEEARLKFLRRSRFDDEIQKHQQRIDQLKAQVVKMLAGTLKIWQRIPQKIGGTPSGL
jgi:hypothetical protein